MKFMTLTNDVAELSPVANLTSGDVNLDTYGQADPLSIGFYGPL